MGNPNIPPQSFDGPAEYPPTAFNGILGRVGGEYVSEGNRQLPPASQAEQAEPVRHAVVDVPFLGAVRITYELRNYRHGRSRFWHWVAKRADQVTPGEP